MRGIQVYKEVSLNSIRFESVLEEIERKTFTGYLKLNYWDKEDYIYYLRGRPVDGIRYLQNGHRERINAQSYALSNMNGVLSMYATSPLEIFAFKESFEEKITPYTFVTYGQEFLGPVELSHIDPEKVLEDVKANQIYGYAVLCSWQGFGPLLAFAGGIPICLYKSGTYVHFGKEVLEVENANSIIAVFRTEPEFVSLITSLHTLKLMDELRLSRLEELKKITGGLEGGFSLLELIIGHGLRLFALISGRSPVFKLLNDCGQFLSDMHVPLVEGDYILKLYRMDIKAQREPLEVRLKVLSEHVEYTSVEKVQRIKKAFVEEIGPIGIVVWKRVFEKMGFEVDKMPLNKLSDFIKMLAEEIPDKKHSDNFLEKARRWLT